VKQAPHDHALFVDHRQQRLESDSTESLSDHESNSESDVDPEKLHVLVKGKGGKGPKKGGHGNERETRLCNRAGFAPQYPLVANAGGKIKPFFNDLRPKSNGKNWEIQSIKKENEVVKPIGYASKTLLLLCAAIKTRH
jgi:hypothetical protein